MRGLGAFGADCVSARASTETQFAAGKDVDGRTTSGHDDERDFFKCDGNIHSESDTERVASETGMTFEITTQWHDLADGAPEERATFAAIGLFVGDLCLSEAEDLAKERIRTEIPLAAYPLAEWLAWNWWRLRWEPRTKAPEWDMAHRLPAIGGGYLWPNVTIVSDGERIVLAAHPTRRRPAEPIRYIADQAALIPAQAFETGVDDFIDRVRTRLHAHGLKDSNLDTIWSELSDERSDPALAERRRLEALLGFDPDEAEPALLDRLLADARRVGESAISEIAATSAGGGEVVTIEELCRQAKQLGFAANPSDMARLASGTALPDYGAVVAWRRGVAAAHALRQQEGLNAEPISNARLAAMAGVTERALDAAQAGPAFAFAVEDGPQQGQVVLRSRWETGRRFELARLLGDRIAAEDGQLHPATQTYTYRQKLQRAFAAELLCPIAALQDMLRGDYSEEAQDDAARHFTVSPRVVEAQLINNGLLERDHLEVEIRAERAAA